MHKKMNGLSKKNKFKTLKNNIKDLCYQKYSSKLNNAINNGFDVNYVDEFGNTLLHYACRERKYKIIKFLLLNNAKPTIVNSDGRLPIHLAAMYGSRRELSSMLDRLDNVTKRIEDSEKIFNVLLQAFPESIRVCDNNNETPLSYYMIHSRIFEIKILNNLCKMLKCDTVLDDDLIYKIEIYLLLKYNKRMLY